MRRRSEDQPSDRNLRAYARLKRHIDETYEHGRFVGIVDGEVVADAETFSDLITRLKAIEPRPDTRLVVQAGVDYATVAVIRRRDVA